MPRTLSALSVWSRPLFVQVLYSGFLLLLHTIDGLCDWSRYTCLQLMAGGGGGGGIVVSENVVHQYNSSLW